MANARRRTQRTTRTIARNMAGAAAMPSATLVDSEEIRTTRTMNWQNELKYINHDLRYLLIISAILFVLLFAVGFFL